MADFHIAIIGAGPSGCALARLLSMASVKVTVFESEKTLDYRSQGGTLDLHTNTGLAALKAAGLHDEFLKYARFDGEAFLVTDKKLVKYINMGGATEGSSRGRPEIDRPQLRKLLAESIPKGCIEWGKRLRRIDDDHTLHFDDGSVASGFDLVVGAEGAWSKVRTLVSSEVPYYTGVSGVQASIPNAQQAFPKLYELCNKGSAFAFEEKKSLMGQQMGDGSISSSSWAISDERTSGKVDPKDAEAVREELRQAYKGWDPLLLDLLLKGDDDKYTTRSLYMLPVGHKWTHRPGVTLIGDAAHLMSPFAGEGVNLALSDAMLLAEAIVKATKDANTPAAARSKLDKNVAAFESEMFVRAGKVQQQTLDMMNSAFSEGGIRKNIEQYMLTAVRDEVPRPLYPLVAGLVYAYFFVFKLFY